MELQDKIKELLQDNKSRTSKEIHMDLILSKKHFFTVNNPLPGITRCCNRMVKDNTLSLESRQGNKKSYLIPQVLDVLDKESDKESDLEPVPDVLDKESEPEPDVLDKERLEDEKQKIVENIIFFEEERNKMDSEHHRQKDQCRNSIIIALLSLGAFAFNYFK